MRQAIKTTTVYTFDELSEAAKQRALQCQAEFECCDSYWYEGIYEDAENAGITITSFYLDRNRHATSTINDAEHTAKQIIKDHGECCETYKTAKCFLDEYAPLNAKLQRVDELLSRQERNNLIDTYHRIESELGELCEEFKKSITEDYSIILQKEYEYRMSDENLIESIEANGYEFDIDGNFYF